MSDTRIPLARAYVASYDALQGEDHQDDITRLRELDDDRVALVERIEARERAHADAQTALFAFDGSGAEPPADNTEAASVINNEWIFAESTDEFSDSRANGAYAED